MQIYRLSASALKAFQKCEFAYFLNYVAKIRSTSSAASKGSCSHGALEAYGNGDKDYLKNLRLQFQKHRPNEQDAGYEEEPKNCGTCPFYQDGICDIYNQNIEDFQGCPREAFDECVRLTEKFLARDDCPLKTNKIIATEKEFDLKIEDIDFKGFIDLVSESGIGLEIRDYKFGKFQPTYKDIKNDVQPKLYDLAIRELMPERSDDIHLVFDYIQKNPYLIVYTPEEAEDNKREIIRLIKAIQNTIIPKRISYSGYNKVKCDKMCVGREACDKYFEKFAKQQFIVEPEEGEEFDYE